MEQEERFRDGIPVSVQRLLKSCLEKNPAHRLRDIGDAWRLIEETPTAAAAARSQSRAAWWIAIAVPTLALAALAIVHFREQSPLLRQ